MQHNSLDGKIPFDWGKIQKEASIILNYFVQPFTKSIKILPNLISFI